MKLENPEFHISVEFREGDFATCPSAFQREWVLRRALREFGDDLDHLATLTPGFVRGVERPEINDVWEPSSAAYDSEELIIQGQQVMQAWEYPLMRRLAEVVGEGHGDVLEIGFGMGISASLLLDIGVRSYTVVECNSQVIGFFEEWKNRFPDCETKLVQGQWQDAVPALGTYDGILFDTYPLSQEEYQRNEVQGLAYTHASEFFPVAARLLRPGGVFSYFSCEIDTLSRGHQRELLKHFDAFEVEVVRGLTPPDGCQYWWSDSMVVVKATKRS